MHALNNTDQAMQNPQFWRTPARKPVAQLRREAKPTQPEGTFTEIFCHHGGLNQLHLLVPTLAKLSQQQQRWITFIAPPCLPNNAALKRAGVDTAKVRVVHTRSVTDYWHTLEEALANGLSSTVLAWPPQGEFNDAHREVLKRASIDGQTQTFVFRQLGVAQNEVPQVKEKTLQLALAL